MEFMAVLTPLLQQATLLLALCNETILCFDSWIYTQSVPSADHPWPENYFAHASITTLIYAIAEPLFCKALIWLSIPPTFYLLSAGTMHLQLIALSTEGLWCSAAEEHLTAMPAREADVALLGADSKSATVVTLPKPVLSTLEKVYAIVRPCSNGSLLLFAHSLHAYGVEITTLGGGIAAFLQTLAIAAYFALIHSTLTHKPLTYRPHFLGTPRWDRHSIVRGSYLALLLSTRLGMRRLLQIDVLPALGFHDAKSVTELYGPDRSEWILRLSAKQPQWATPIISIGALIAQIGFVWFQRRNQKKNHEKLECLAASMLENGERKVESG